MSLSEASPKAISRRTSYLRVRLEFHRYPQVIPTLFNAYGFGPPRDFTPASTCPWIGHPVSGPRDATFSPFSGSLSLRLRRSSALTSPRLVTRWPVLQKVRGHFRSLRLWARGFRFSFTPLPGFFSPFPHGTVRYRSLGSVQPWGVVPPASRRVPRVRRYSGAAPAKRSFRLRGFHPLRPRFPTRSARNLPSFERSSTPGAVAPGLGSFPFARRYLGYRCFFLFLRVLRCFSSPRRLPRAYLLRRAMPVHCDGRVPPFGHPRFDGYLPLPAAFRSLSRPSSAPSAKASASCLSSLDLSSLSPGLA